MSKELTPYDPEDDECDMELIPHTASDVSDAWDDFKTAYDEFRADNGLKNGEYSAFEICTALSDKNGRICREIKHAERNDHKPDWTSGMTKAMAGYIVYMFMLMDKYDCELGDGLKKELQSAIDQYSKK